MKCYTKKPQFTFKIQIHLENFGQKFLFLATKVCEIWGKFMGKNMFKVHKKKNDLYSESFQRHHGKLINIILVFLLLTLNTFRAIR